MVPYGLNKLRYGKGKVENDYIVTVPNKKEKTSEAHPLKCILM